MSTASACAALPSSVKRDWKGSVPRSLGKDDRRTDLLGSVAGQELALLGHALLRYPDVGGVRVVAGVASARAQRGYRRRAGAQERVEDQVVLEGVQLYEPMRQFNGERRGMPDPLGWLGSDIPHFEGASRNSSVEIEGRCGRPWVRRLFDVDGAVEAALGCDDHPPAGRSKNCSPAQSPLGATELAAPRRCGQVSRMQPSSWTTEVVPAEVGARMLARLGLKEPSAVSVSYLEGIRRASGVEYRTKNYLLHQERYMGPHRNIEFAIVTRPPG